MVDSIEQPLALCCHISGFMSESLYQAATILHPDNGSGWVDGARLELLYLLESANGDQFTILQYIICIHDSVI